VNLAQEPVYLASGLYFPVSSFPRFIALGVSVIPLTLALDAMRQLMLPGARAWGVMPVWIEMTLLALSTVVFVVAARHLLGHMEQLARREGRLTEKHV